MYLQDQLYGQYLCFIAQMTKFALESSRLTGERFVQHNILCRVYREYCMYMPSRVPLCTGSRTGPSKAKHSSVVGGVSRQRQKKPGPPKGTSMLSGATDQASPKCNVQRGSERGGEESDWEWLTEDSVNKQNVVRGSSIIYTEKGVKYWNTLVL